MIKLKHLDKFFRS